MPGGWLSWSGGCGRVNRLGGAMQTIECEYCGKVTEKTFCHKRFCSKNCKRVAKKKRNRNRRRERPTPPPAAATPMVTCERCGIACNSSSDNQRFCSKSCQVLAWRERNREKQAIYYLENRERCLSQTKAWHKRNPERSKELAANWAKKNKRRRRELDEKRRIPNLAAQKIRCRNLVDGYVAMVIGLPIAAIPPELIEAKRAQLLLTRELRKGER